jgi:hypothetical protein
VRGRLSCPREVPGFQRLAEDGVRRRTRACPRESEEAVRGRSWVFRRLTDGGIRRQSRACSWASEEAVGGTLLGLPPIERRRLKQGEAQEWHTWHATWPVSVGQDPGEAEKLRRGSAIANGVTARWWYGFTVGATPWRRQRSEKRASVCGDGRLASTIMLVRWKNVTRAIQRRRAGGPGGEGKPLEGEKPHGRFRHETRPGVRARSKPARGCETLWTERTR